jgi:hypothetical protein
MPDIKYAHEIESLGLINPDTEEVIGVFVVTEKPTLYYYGDTSKIPIGSVVIQKGTTLAMFQRYGTGNYEYKKLGFVNDDDHPPEESGDGDFWYNSGINLFYFDQTRERWLSTNKLPFLFSRNGSNDGTFLKLGDVISSDVGFYFPEYSVITDIYARAGSGNATKQLDVVISDPDGNDVTVYSFSLSDYSYNSNMLSIVVLPEHYVKMFISSEGGPVSDVIVQMHASIEYVVHPTSAIRASVVTT